MSARTHAFLVLTGLLVAPACDDNGASPAFPGGASEPLAGCADLRATVLRGGVADGGGRYVCTLPVDLPSAPDTVVIVDDDGSLLVSPGPEDVLARSRDNGETWERVDPQGGATGRAARIHPFLTRDPRSGRVFYSAYAPSGEPECGHNSGTGLWFSDDFGDSWTPGVAGCDDSKDFGKVFTGPAATDAERSALQDSGYPSTVYFCAEGPTFILGPLRQCYRSTDGGVTFERTAAPAVDPMRNGYYGWPLAGAVGRDGTIFMTHTTSGDTRSGLAVTSSDDGGDAWSTTIVPNSAFAVDIIRIAIPGADPAADPPTINYLSSNVATDAEGNVYVAWVDDADLEPYVAFSHDSGAQWSTPLAVGAPGVETAVNINLAVDAAGSIAVAYLGSPDPDFHGGDGYTTSDGRAYDAYLVAIPALFSDVPALQSARVNPKGKPILEGMTYEAGGEYLGAPAFGPDGSIWAAFVDEASGKTLLARMLPE